MPYSDAWGATIQQDTPTAGDITMTLTSGGVTCSATARTEIGAKDDLARCFCSQPGPAPRLWWLRYRIARAVACRAKWVLVRAVLAAGNQNRSVTRGNPLTGDVETRTAGQWLSIVDQIIARAQADWDNWITVARSEGGDE